MKTYTASDVLKNNTTDCLWIIYNKNVYDITNFYPHHPGGKALLKYAGKTRKMILSQMKSSLALQITLKVTFTYSLIYFIMMLLIFMYKVSTFTYPMYIKIIEGLLIFEILPLEILKNSWAKRGNLTETWAYLLLSILLNILMGLICLVSLTRHHIFIQFIDI
uniref:AB hydrolase-1 domain-containing protein n=2 Tax=Strongyloides stercoralis TaxID=6248 RepID=A0AAF5DNR9_STRER